MELYNFNVKHLAPTARERPDGDSMSVLMDLGVRVLIGVRFRLMRINCPELITGAPGIAARDHTKLLWPHESWCLVKTFKDPTDKYGRWLAEVTLSDGRNLSDVLVADGHAVYQSY